MKDLMFYTEEDLSRIASAYDKESERFYIEVIERGNLSRHYFESLDEVSEFVHFILSIVLKIKADKMNAKK